MNIPQNPQLAVGNLKTTVLLNDKPPVALLLGDIGIDLIEATLTVPVWLCAKLVVQTVYMRLGPWKGSVLTVIHVLPLPLQKAT
jgi:hypothetical protein